MKKISANTLRSYLKYQPDPFTVRSQIQVKDKGYDFELKCKLSLSDQIKFIDRVLSGCFDAAGDYRPEYTIPMIRATILQMCTNASVIPMKGMAEINGAELMDIDAMNDLYLALKLDDCCDEFSEFYTEMECLCRDAIEWKRRRIAARDAAPDISAFDAFGHMATAIEKAVVGTLEKVSKQIEDVDVDSMMQYAQKISGLSGGIDNEGLAKAVLSIYGGADGAATQEDAGDKDE